MINKLIKTLLLSTGLLITAPAFANITYTYTGNALVEWTNEPVIKAIDPITISMIFSDNGSTLIDWTASQAQVGDISKSSTSGITASNMFPILGLTTDASGQVTSWFVSVISAWDLNDPNNSSNYHQNIMSFNGQNSDGTEISPYSFQLWDLAYSLSPLPDRQVIAWGFNRESSGTWTSNGVLANLKYQSPVSPVSPVPEPETYAMMLTGFGLMGFVARRRKNQQA